MVSRKICGGFVGLWVVLLLMGGCGGSGGGNNPDQKAVDKALQDMVLTAELLVADFTQATSCAEISDAVALFNGQTVPCDSGTVTVNAVNFDPDTDCSDGPPLSVLITLSVVTNDCADNALGTVSDGAFTVEIEIVGNDITVVLSSSGIVFNEINFTFSDVTGTVSAGDMINCTGTMTVNGDACEVSPDCSACPLE